MSRIHPAIQLLIALAALVLWAAPSSAQQTISCSSDDMHRHYCPTDTHGSVRLYQQHSDAACRQGYSWGYDRHGIWVDHGCRADFQLADNGWGRDRDRDDERWHDGYHPGGDHDRDDDDRYRRSNGEYGSSIQAITCSSDDMRRHYCPANTHGGVRLFKQHSDAVCREGDTWGYDDHGIWVDRGCRADFQTGMGGR